MIEERRLRKEITIPAGIEVHVDEIVTVKKNTLEVKKKLSYPTVKLSKKDNKIIIEPKRFTKREKKIINTFKSHIANMIKGVEEPYEYQLKVCSSHFPMSVTIEVKNDGDVITIHSPDKEIAGQTAANFEQCTRITNKDRRIFQDGLWITKKSRG